MEYDAVLIHPPAIYDFREKVIFSGPIAYTAAESTEQFIIPSIGILSIADYLDRNGYRVIVDNLGERMVDSEDFDVREHIRNLSARVYAVGLHWCVHCQGAIEIARLCKELHPDAMVILGGLTSTVFHQEIIEKYEFVDAVIRAEAEKPFLQLMRALDCHEKLNNVANLTFREEGKVISMPLMEPSTDLDEFEFTRLDLLEPKRAVFGPGWPAHWIIPVCRGCSYNCVACGGSASCYKTYLGMKKPAFRSPEKIADDIRKLIKQGIQYVFLCQDPRMGGKDYWEKLVRMLQKARFRNVHLSMDLFRPLDESEGKEISKIDTPVAFNISPESCSDTVRHDHGRPYNNDGLFKTIEICNKYNIPLGVYTMIPLVTDTAETIKDNWKLWEKICSMGEKAKGNSPVSPLHYVFGQMILLDPGSLAFNSPEKYGYHLLFNNLEDYIQGMSLPSWHQWISFETMFLNRDEITKLIIDSIECSTKLREKYGLYSEKMALKQNFRFVTASRLAINEVNRLTDIQDEEEKLKRLKDFDEDLNNRLHSILEQ
jgi:B12-binding domain/radical SAM domain protein